MFPDRAYDTGRNGPMAASPPPVFTRGPGTLGVSFELHCENRARLVEAMRATDGAATEDTPRGVVLLQGGAQPTRHSSDHELLFRQESYFQWLFGVKEAGCFGAVDLADGRSALFIPRLPKVRDDASIPHSYTTLSVVECK